MYERHGHSYRGKRSATYTSWQSMHQRCTNPKLAGYKDYGGRGIKVCERWRTFELFLEDMGERPKNKTLDRYPDGNGNYEPGNCRWASRAQQASNRRRPEGSTLTHSCGLIMTVAEWAKEWEVRTGKSASLFRVRLKKGMTVDALFEDLF